MLVRLRREYAQLVTSGAQLVLLAVGVKLDSREGWLGTLSAMALISFFAWLSALKRLRTVRDTPTSKVASAAQGYVELSGRGLPFGDTPLVSRLSKLPCLWYRYRIERRSSKNEWQTVDSYESDDSFILNDGTGDCIVDPDHAEIITRHRDRWQRGNHRYTEWRLIKGDEVYVIGQFRTQGGSTAMFDSREELNAVLTEWKKDMPALHARFDLNGDGTLDMKEWMLARSAARREVNRRMREAHAAPDVHIIGQPRDGKLFLISNLDSHDLSRRYLFWTWAHVAILFCALAGTGWLLQTQHSFRL